MRSTRWITAILAAGLVMVVCAMASRAAPGPVTDPLCAPGECAAVIGTVRLCTASIGSDCRFAHVTSLRAMTARRQLAIAEFHFVGRYRLELQTAGTYTLILRYGSKVIRRRVRAVVGRTVDVNFVIASASKP